MQEIERQKKVISMLITMHSILKERYFNLSSFFEIFLLASSVILNALIFVDNQFILNITGISIDNQKIICGIASIIVFIISIVLLQVNWKERASKHAQAAEQLSVLLQECRSIIFLPSTAEKEIRINEFEKKYSQIFTILVKIPDNEFNSLKSQHYKKIELSKMIEKSPGSLLWVLKIKLFFSSFK